MELSKRLCLKTLHSCTCQCFLPLSFTWLLAIVSFFGQVLIALEIFSNAAVQITMPILNLVYNVLSCQTCFLQTLNYWRKFVKYLISQGSLIFHLYHLNLPTIHLTFKFGLNIDFMTYSRIISHVTKLLDIFFHG